MKITDKKSGTMKFKTAIVLSAFIMMLQTTSGLRAQDAKPSEDMKTFPAQISFVYPIGTHGNQTIYYSYNLSINMLYGSVGAVRGVEFGGLINKSGYVDGAQFGGLINTSGNVNGAQFAGLINKSGDVDGAQFAGLVNKSGNAGTQFAGIVNISSETSGGMQAAMLNRTGVLNGLQLGVVNIADTIESGISIGLISIVKHGAYDEWSLTFADYQNVGLSYKLGTKKLYTIFNAGANFIEDGLWVFGIGLGNRTSLGGRIDFQPELVSYNYFRSDFSYDYYDAPDNCRNIQNMRATHLKLGFVYKLGGRFGISVAPGIYYRNADADRNKDYLNISSVAPFYEYESDYRRHSFGAGVSVGLVFN